MKDLNIKQQKNNLEVNCSEGKIDMKGNSIVPNAQSFFKPVFDWVDEYVKKPAKNTKVTLRFDYIDTASVQAVFDLLKALKEVEVEGNSLVVDWHFEFDDPELLEVGEIMEARLGVKFNYIEYMN